MRVGSSTLNYLLSDHLGSTAITVNSGGTAEVGELRYYAYGKTRYNSGSTPTSYRFTGQREDATIGLYFYNARYYDASLGWFVQADSMVPEPGNPQSLNRYSYVLNSPLKYTDPSGHEHWLGEGGGESWRYVSPMGRWSAREQSAMVDRAASLVVDFTPIVGDAKGVAEGVTGKDLVTGESIGFVGRVLSLMCLSELRHADEVAGLLKYADEVLENGVPIGRSIGRWGMNSPSMSEAARAYQEFVTGAARGWEFNRNGVWFDGIRFAETGGEVLVDAKAIPGNFVDLVSGSFQHWVSGTDDWLQQAANQVQAAGGIPIEWAFDNQAARDAMYNLFLERNPDLLKSIDLVFRPMPSP
jgi:RHS repeat-associated protein